MDQQERRATDRVEFKSKAIMVILKTEEVLQVEVRDLGPVGIGISASPGTPDLVGKEVVLVTEAMVMHADVVRQMPAEDGRFIIGLAARKFTKQVLEFLMESLELMESQVSD